MGGMVSPTCEGEAFAKPQGMAMNESNKKIPVQPGQENKQWA